MNDRAAMRGGIWAIVALLIVLHHDLWLWESTTLLFGFLPVSLAYHMGISAAAGIVWFLATRYAWPSSDELASASEEREGGAA